jgi:hypothetical protein
MNLLLNMDSRNLPINLAEATNKIIHLFLRLKPEAIHKINSNQQDAAFVAPGAGGMHPNYSV